MTLSIVTPSVRRHLRPCPVVLLRARDVAHSDRLVKAGELVRIRPGVLVAAQA